DATRVQEPPEPPKARAPPVEEHICDAVSDLAVHAAWCILERNSDAVILEVRRRAARPCLEGSKSRNRLSERCAWPVVFFCGAIPSALTTSAAPIHHLQEAGTMFKRLLVLGPAAL